MAPNTGNRRALIKPMKRQSQEENPGALAARQDMGQSYIDPFVASAQVQTLLLPTATVRIHGN